MKKILIVTIAIFLLIPGIARGEDIRFEATLERNRVSTGNPVYLYLAVYGDQSAQRVKIPPISGLKIKYVGPSTKVSIVNGRISRSITHTYLVIPLKGGEFKIGPFFAECRGEIYKADAVTLVTSDTPAQAARPGSPSARPGSPSARPAGDRQRTESYASDKIFLIIDIDKTSVYINEVAIVTIKIYVDGMGLRDIEYPTYSHEGFSTGEFEEPQKRQETLQGMRYDVLTFRQKLFAIKEGEYTLGPARLGCKLMVRRQQAARRRSSFFGISVSGDNFFGGRLGGYQIYPVELESDPIPIRVLPFPEEGKPEDFQGAVGDFSIDVHVDPPEVKVGDPVVLRMTVRGKGDLSTVTSPYLAVTDKFKTYEPQVEKKGNKKIYEQILIPKSAEMKAIPEISFSFFNPMIGEYETIRKGPFPLKVTERPESERGVKMVSLPGAEEMFYPVEKLGKDIIHIKENIGELRGRGYFLYRDRLFWAAQLVPFLLLLIFYAGYRRKERIQSDESYARFVKAPRKARRDLAKAKSCLGKDNMLPFYDAVFKTLQNYLGDRFNLPRGNVTSQVIEERLRPSGCDEKMLEALRDIFSRCEMARYASSVPGGREAEDMLEKVRKMIVYLERIKI